MRKLIAVSLFLLAANTSPVFSQEHAPTVTQCRADERLWSAESMQAGAGTGFESPLKDYSLNELILRSKEMAGCVVVDPPNKDNYPSTAMLIMSTVNKRLVRYVQETGQADRYDSWERLQSSK
jgi:hypothetical protein